MAISKGKASVEAQEFKHYIGVAAVKVTNVNPNKEELEKFYNREISAEPVYVGEREINGAKYPQVRITFTVATDPEQYKDNEGNPIELKNTLSMFLVRAPRVSKAGKKQIIDKYGRTAWATEEEINNKRIPINSNGKPANIDANYRIAYTGEEELIKFIIAYLNIDPCQDYINNEWVMKKGEDLANCEVALEHIEDYFKGDFKELKEIVTYQPNNKVKVLFGIRKDDNGSMYQNAYTRMFLKNNNRNYNKLRQEVTESQAAGAYSTTEFQVVDLKEYTVEETVFDKPEETNSMNTPWG